MPTSGHENGDCEQSHRRLKEALEQELLLRGSRDFASREEYTAFVGALVARRNGAGRRSLGTSRRGYVRCRRGGWKRRSVSGCGSARAAPSR